MEPAWLHSGAPPPDPPDAPLQYGYPEVTSLHAYDAPAPPPIATNEEFELNQLFPPFVLWFVVAVKFLAPGVPLSPTESEYELAGVTAKAVSKTIPPAPPPPEYAPDPPAPPPAITRTSMEVTPVGAVQLLVPLKNIT